MSIFTLKSVLLCYVMKKNVVTKRYNSKQLFFFILERCFCGALIVLIAEEAQTTKKTVFSSRTSLKIVQTLLRNMWCRLFNRKFILEICHK